MGQHVHTRSFGGRRTTFGLGFGMVAGAVLGLLPLRSAGGVSAARPARGRSALPEPAAPEPGSKQAPEPAPEPQAYEYLSRVVWSDHIRGITSDLEDSEGLEATARDGWELVNVIVPFAQTRRLDISYPGNTRKLIAYYRRPEDWEKS
jgi:hypothetical protein